MFLFHKQYKFVQTATKSFESLEKSEKNSSGTICCDCLYVIFGQVEIISMNERISQYQIGEKGMPSGRLLQGAI